MAGGLKADDARPCLLSHSVKLYLVWKHSRGSVKIMSYNGIFARISHVTSNSSKGQVRHVRRHFVFFFFVNFLISIFFFFLLFFFVLFLTHRHATRRQLTHPCLVARVHKRACNLNWAHHFLCETISIGKIIDKN